ncbi:Dpy-30 motif containing protein, putative [Trypanosoma equiperdum]|uniref:Nucleoside diphosphate kinase n=2 Tax=Trypanozoon TaxID=39700 RepID=Q386D5_TRYB2|nr:hypothetical protein, conserved [Trypanosoma brucei brucei TREU927]EAN79346.1 hypothetical protein, conserved [Trypanosoma brucei brucei TREU927]SCU68160.1 Dpy-30 motif containing protein, putative [Trypanosoma equiperdum]
MIPALNGVVTKTVLLVRPRYAQQLELRALTKYKLHEAGFIIVREEYRRVNEELADKIAVQLDRAAFLSGTAAPEEVEAVNEGDSATNGSRMFTRSHVTVGAQELVGNAYLYVLAHRDCHAELLRFLDRLFADEDYTMLLMSINEEGKEAGSAAGSAATQQQGDSRGPSIQCPLFCNVTSVAAKQVVQLLFPRMLVHDVPNRTVTREYVQAELKNALMPALVELSRAKPENPIRWLAERLLNTNVRAPPLISAANGDTEVTEQ